MPRPRFPERGRAAIRVPPQSQIRTAALRGFPSLSRPRRVRVTVEAACVNTRSFDSTDSDILVLQHTNRVRPDRAGTDGIVWYGHGEVLSHNDEDRRRNVVRASGLLVPGDLLDRLGRSGRAAVRLLERPAGNPRS